MRNAIFVFLGFFSFLTCASTTRTELQLGFPSLLSLRLDRELAPSWRFGFGVGAIPLTFGTVLYRPTVNTNLSDDYRVKIEVDPQAVTSGFFLERALSEVSYLRLEFQLGILAVSGQSYIENRQSGAVASYVNMDLMAFLPRVMLSYGARLVNRNDWDVHGGIGLTYLFAHPVVVVSEGPAEAYYDAVPTARDAVQDGLSNVETEFTSALSEYQAFLPVLPVIWIGAVW